MTHGRRTVIRFLSVLVCLAPLLSTMAATRYRVTLAYPGDDASVIAKRLAAAYHGQLETSVDESGTFDITLSSATAKLLRRDPQVARLEAPVVASGAATPWMSGTYEYDPAGNIRRIGTSLYVYAS